MNANLWRSSTADARREAWPKLSPEEKQSLQVVFGPDPVLSPWPSASGRWPLVLGVTLLVIVTIALLWWRGESQRQLAFAAAAADDRATRALHAQPGYQSGYETGMVYGLGGKSNATDAVLERLVFEYAKQGGHSEDTAWKLAFRTGYRAGLLDARSIRR